MIDSSSVTQHAQQVCTTHQPSFCLPFACAGTKHTKGSCLLESVAWAPMHLDWVPKIFKVLSVVVC
jgi:hypothetical protein